MNKLYNLKLTLLVLALAFLGTNSFSQTEVVFDYSGSIETYTVPDGVTVLRITAEGAQGGNNGGVGAIMQGDFNVTPGEEISILVGQQGVTDGEVRSGGGGGSFVIAADDEPMIIAGGGGGRSWNGTGEMPLAPGIDANITENGNDGYSEGNGLEDGYLFRFGSGGTEGNGGGMTIGADGSPHAGNGGGFLTNGVNGDCGSGGASYLTGGAGGTGCLSAFGGFGGGGSGGNSGGGGGGGYSGGGGAYHNPTNGGGAGSFNAGANQNNNTGRTGNGLITILENPCDVLTTTVSSTDLCSADMLTLFAESSNGGVISWDNDVENGVEFQPNMVGEFTFTATSSHEDDCSFIVTILFRESPEYDLVVANEVFVDDGIIALELISGIFPFQYDWSNDGTGDFDDPQNLTGIGAGTYSVTVSHDNGCTRTKSATLTDVLSIEDQKEKSMLAIYPNPIKDIAVIAFNGAFQYEIINVLGETVINGKGFDQETLNMEILKEGNYFVRVSNENQVVTQKVTRL